MMEYVLVVQAVLAAGVAVALLFPGEQPEKAFQWALDLLKKISKK